MKNNKKYRITFVISLALLAVVLVAVGLGLGLAKYRTQKAVGGNVSFTVALAERMSIQESKANRSADGTYTLDTADTVTANTYKLMPGVDVPKDPYITVTGKTELPGWLFVEVVESENFPGTVTYKVDPAWTIIDGLTGENGGQIYVYNTTLTDKKPENITKFYILDGNQLTVSDKLPRGTTAELTFYGYLCQKISDNAAADFAAIYGTGATVTAAPATDNP